MSLNDPLAGLLSQIVAYEKAGKKELVTKNTSKMIKKILELLQDNQYIGSFEETIDSKGNILKVHLLGRINETGVVKPRFSLKNDEFEKFEKRYLPARDFGLLILSTPDGLMTHTEAKSKKIGGRLICYCY